MPLPQILGLTVLGTFVAVIGNLVALYLKDVLAVRSFERWKAQQTLLEVYRRYQLPIFLAAEDLGGRLYGLARPDNDRPPREIGVDTFAKELEREPHAMVSDHYLQYRFVSNIYRLCSFLGWIELYRRDIGTLDVDSLDRNHRLKSCLHNIRSALSDGWINQHPEQESWRDCLIFREELRAIGHRMVAADGALALIDFGTFFDTLRGDATGRAEARWFMQAALFFESLKRDKDFRLVRMRMLVVFLTDLMEILQPGRIDREHVATALKWFDAIDTDTSGRGWRSKEGHVDAVRARLAAAAR